jgi:glycosyltransferase 2 family protein
MRRRISFFLKLIVTIVLILFILSKVEYQAIFEVLLGINLWYLFWLAVISVIMVMISCLKWQLFLKTQGIQTPLLHLFLYYLVGYFFNNLLPSSIGGDFLRSYFLGQDIDSQAKSFSSVFLERITGLVALLFVGIIALIFNTQLYHDTSILLCIAAMFLILLVVVFFFIFEQAKDILLAVTGRFVGLGPVRRAFEKFYASVHFFKGQIRILGISMIYSFAFHLMTIVNALVCCWAINIHPKVLDLAVTVPIIMLISVIPVSISAIGLWEGAFAYFFFIIGIEPAAAVSVALILRAKSLLLGLVGGLIFLLRDKWLLGPKVVADRPLPKSQ